MLGIYNFFSSKGQTVAFMLGLLVVAIVLGMAISGIGSAGYTMGTDLNEVLKTNENETFGFFNPAVMLPAFMVLVIVGFIAIFSLRNLISDPKGSLKFLVGFAVVLILFFILYSTSSAETSGVMGKLHDEFNVTESASKLISAGIMTTLILLGAAVVLMIITSIYNMFK